MSRVWLPPITIHRRLTLLEVPDELGWPLRDYGLPELWTKANGQGITVGVIDTGMDPRHAQQGDLSGAVKGTQDFTRSRSGAVDIHGHGTHCAGIIGARLNQQGACGVAPECQIVAAKALGDDGSGSDASIEAAAKWCIQQGATVLNLSLGSNQPSRAMERMAADAEKAGVVMVCASGNDGADNSVNWPAAYESVCAVGAIDQSRRLANFSSRGPEVDCVAPGVRIRSTYLNGQYAELSGTSMATPYVAGLVALVQSQELKTLGRIETRTARQFLKLLETAVDDLGRAGADPQYGLGVPVPEKLLGRMVPAPVPPAPPVPGPVAGPSVGRAINLYGFLVDAVKSDGKNWVCVAVE